MRRLLGIEPDEIDEGDADRRRLQNEIRPRIKPHNIEHPKGDVRRRMYGIEKDEIKEEDVTRRRLSACALLQPLEMCMHGAHAPAHNMGTWFHVRILTTLSSGQ